MRVKSLTPPLPSVLPMTAITSSAVNCPAAGHAYSPDAYCTLLSSTLATSTDIALSTLEHVWSIHKCAGHSLRFPRRRGHPYIQVVIFGVYYLSLIRAASSKSATAVRAAGQRGMWRRRELNVRSLDYDPLSLTIGARPRP